MVTDENNKPDSIEVLLENWTTQTDDSAFSLDQYVDLATRALGFGQPSLAYDILNRGLKVYPEDPTLTYRAALSLARTGSFRAANDLLDPLLQRLQQDSNLYLESLALAGRLAKDCYQNLTDEKAKAGAARESAQRYKTAFDQSGEYFPGVNAATMSILCGDTAQGQALARQVLGICSGHLLDGDSDDYWLLATIGEANLLLGNGEEAAHWYQRATGKAGDRVGDVASMRRQVRLLSSVLPIDAGVLQALDIPKVVAFAGHMLDRPNSSNVRFPAALEAVVRSEIRDALERLGAEFGFASAACGGDILFLEEMLARGGQIHVVLPFKRDDFIETSVAFAGGDWVARFNAVLAKATTVTYATVEGYLGDDILFQYAADLINGLALLRSEQMATDPVMLTVLDPESVKKPGGTTDHIGRWRERSKRAEIIDISRLRQTINRDGNNTVEDNNQRTETVHERQAPRQIRTMLFADVVGFSKLREEAAPSFFVEFLGQVAQVIKHSDPSPTSCNTWGDGLFIVFDSVAGAADFSLRLRDMVVSNDWAKVGLPEDTNIRIAVHAGPVYQAYDPIIERENFFGAHVNRAARIEPVTAPGSVFVSEQTACLLAAQGNESFSCDYLGVMDFAKKFGSGALYRLRRSNEVD